MLAPSKEDFDLSSKRGGWQGKNIPNVTMGSQPRLPPKARARPGLTQPKGSELGSKEQKTSKICEKC